MKCNRPSQSVGRAASGRRAARARPGARRAVPTGAPRSAHVCTATRARQPFRDRPRLGRGPSPLESAQWTVQCSVPERAPRTGAACGERPRERAAGAPRLADPMRAPAARPAPLLLALALACCLQVRVPPHHHTPHPGPGRLLREDCTEVTV